MVGFNFHVLVPLLAGETLHVGPGGLRPALGVVRPGRARRRARHGELPRRELAPVRDRRRGASACSRSPSRRCRAPMLAGVLLFGAGHLVHAVHRQRERARPARRAGSAARPADRPLPVRVRRDGADRRPVRRLARGRSAGRRSLSPSRASRPSHRSRSRTRSALAPSSRRSDTPASRHARARRNAAYSPCDMIATVDVYRTPDERFEGLPGLLVRAAGTSSRTGCGCTTSRKARATPSCSCTASRPGRSSIGS